MATAVIEAGAGLALGCLPSAVVALLLGSGLDSPVTVVLGRLTGAALLALGVACWLARGDAQSRAARGLIAAMAVYNLGAVALFAFASFGLGLHGIALVAGRRSARGNGCLVHRAPAAPAGGQTN